MFDTISGVEGMKDYFEIVCQYPNCCQPDKDREITCNYGCLHPKCKTCYPNGKINDAIGKTMKIKLPEDYIMREKERPMTRQEAVNKLVKLDINGRDKINARNLLEALEALGLIKFEEEKKDKSIPIQDVLANTKYYDFPGDVMIPIGVSNAQLIIKNLENYGYVIEQKDGPREVPKGFYSEAEIRRVLDKAYTKSNADAFIDGLKKGV